MCAALLAATAQYFFKKYIRHFNVNMKGIYELAKNKHAILGLFLYLASFVIYIYALSKAPSISFVYPVFASSFVFVFIISRIKFGEEINLKRYVGIALVIIGIIIVAFTY